MFKLVFWAIFAKTTEKAHSWTDRPVVGNERDREQPAVGPASPLEDEDFQKCPQRSTEQGTPCDERRGVGFFQVGLRRTTLELHLDYTEQSAAELRRVMGNHHLEDAVANGTDATAELISLMGSHPLVDAVANGTDAWVGLAASNTTGSSIRLLVIHIARDWVVQVLNTAEHRLDHFWVFLALVVLICSVGIGLLAYHQCRPHSAVELGDNNSTGTTRGFPDVAERARQSIAGMKTRSTPAHRVLASRLSASPSRGHGSPSPAPALKTSHAAAFTQDAGKVPGPSPHCDHQGHLVAAIPFSDSCPHHAPEPFDPMPVAAVCPKRFCPQLCPGLVVPSGSECVLAVRPLLTTDSPSAAVEVMDLSGKALLKAQVARPLQWNQVDAKMISAPPWRSSPPAIELHMLQPIPGPGLLESVHARHDSSVLATCRAGEMSDGRRYMFFYDANGELFGHMAKDHETPRYLFSASPADTRADPTDVKRCVITFDGIFADHAVAIANENQEQLADAEPSTMAFSPQDKFYMLRVASGVDVGLLICGLAAIDEMEIG